MPKPGCKQKKSPGLRDVSFEKDFQAYKKRSHTQRWHPKRTSVRQRYWGFADKTNIWLWSCYPCGLAQMSLHVLLHIYVHGNRRRNRPRKRWMKIVTCYNFHCWTPPTGLQRTELAGDHYWGITKLELPERDDSSSSQSH